MPLILLLGGASSGKSSLAVRMAEAWDGPVHAVFTAEALDAEMAERIKRHRARRPDHWTVVEEPCDLETALARLPSDGFAIVDCLTLWVSNLMGKGVEDDEIVRRAGEAARIAAERPPPTIVVSNEVGSGIVPTAALARRYRDVLGSVNSIWAQLAERALLIVGGRALPLTDPLDLLGDWR